MDSDPETFEKVYVGDIYDQIARQFGHTRQNMWQTVKDFVHKISLESDIKIADIGCGNGINMMDIKSKCIGVDTSLSFVNICLERGLNVIQGSILNLPFEDNCFDYVLCVAVIHHFCTDERRMQAIKELLRITKPKGQIFITVWSLNAIDIVKSLKTSHVIGDQPCDRLVRWGTEVDMERFYHLFRLGELEELVYSTDDSVTILQSFTERDNWGVIVQK